MFRRRPLTGRPMSALGQKRTCAVHKPMSALPSKADIRHRAFRTFSASANRETFVTKHNMWPLHR